MGWLDGEEPATGYHAKEGIQVEKRRENLSSTPPKLDVSLLLDYYLIFWSFYLELDLSRDVNNKSGNFSELVNYLVRTESIF